MLHRLALPLLALALTATALPAVADAHGKSNDKRAAKVERFDVDGNGTLSDDERDAMRAAWAERRSEGKKHGKRHAAMQEAFTAADADENGALDRDEARAFLKHIMVKAREERGDAKRPASR